MDGVKSPQNFIIMTGAVEPIGDEIAEDEAEDEAEGERERPDFAHKELGEVGGELLIKRGEGERGEAGEDEALAEEEEEVDVQLRPEDRLLRARREGPLERAKEQGEHGEGEGGCEELIEHKRARVALGAGWIRWGAEDWAVAWALAWAWAWALARG